MTVLPAATTSDPAEVSAGARVEIGAELAPPSGSGALWRRLLPFVIALSLVAFVVARLDFAAFWASLGRVDAPLLLGAAALFVLALLAADSFATALVYRRTLARIGFRELFVVRGASYVPSLLNHHVGQAFITVFLSRTHGVALGRVAGATLLVYASWTGCILGLACVALVTTGKPLAWLALPLGAGCGYLVLLALRPPWLARRRVLEPLFEAGVRGHLVAAVARVPHLLVLFFGTWLPFVFYGVDIPLGAALTYVPITMVAVTLPITPQGFGTRDALAAQFFAAYAPGATLERRHAALAAATLSWGVAITLVEAALGLWLMTRVMPRVRAKAG